MLWAADPFEDRWRAAADRAIAVKPESIVFDAASDELMLGLMRLYQRTKYPLYADFVEGWARHHLVGGPPKDHAPSLALLLLQEARPQPLLERYCKSAIDSAEGPEDASFLARYGMTQRQPGLVLRAARSLPLRPPLEPRGLLTIADVLEGLEPMQPDYEPLASCAQSVQPNSGDLLSLAATWKLFRIQVVPASRARLASDEWKAYHERTPEPGGGRYFIAAAESPLV